MLSKGIERGEGMNVQGFVESALWLCEWIMRLAYVNLLWLLFTLAGMIVFGIAPATAALFSVQVKWSTGDVTSPIFRTFWKNYKASFLKANLLGYFLAIVGWLLYFNLTFFATHDGVINKIVGLITLTVAIWYLITLFYSFPIYASYNLKTIRIIKNAFIVGMLNPILTFGMILSSGSVIFIVLYFPKLLLFFGISLPCLMIMLFSNQVFQKIDDLKERSPELA